MIKLNWFRVITRLLVFAAFVVVYLIRGFYIHYRIKEPFDRKKRFARLNCWIQALCCRTFKVQIEILNAPPANTPGLFIGNHLGFLDILSIGGSRPLLFVTSQEMRETPVLGLLTEMAGCIYVERRSRKSIHDELKNLIEALKEGHNICLFPEATSHNGERVLPFKRTLMTAAAHANVPIFPYTLNFIEIDGEPFSLKNRDLVCWYGDMPFVKALFSSLSIGQLKVQIKFHAQFDYKPEMDRAEVADHLHDVISNDFKIVSIN
ncbi:MAG: lysophospholipid acyltransferase family protein [Bdellovibrionales bacterium]